MLNKEQRKIKKTTSSFRNTRTNSSENKSLLSEGKSQLTVLPDGTLEETIRHQGQTYVRSFKRKDGPLGDRHIGGSRYPKPNFDSGWFKYNSADHQINHNGSKKIPHPLGQVPLNYEILFAPGQGSLWDTEGRIEWFTKVNNCIYGHDTMTQHLTSHNHRDDYNTSATSRGQVLFNATIGLVSCVDTKAFYIANGDAGCHLGSDFGANNNGNNTDGWIGWSDQINDPGNDSSVGGSVLHDFTKEFEDWEDRPSIYPMNGTTTARYVNYVIGAMRVLFWL